MSTAAGDGSGDAAGGDAAIAVDYAWVELYEKRDGQWRMVGNVSNQAP